MEQSERNAQRPRKVTHYTQRPFAPLEHSPATLPPIGSSNISGNFLYKIFHNVFPFCGSEFYKENMFFFNLHCILNKGKTINQSQELDD
jgi:hypothetical protein